PGRRRRSSRSPPGAPGPPHRGSRRRFAPSPRPPARRRTGACARDPGRSTVPLPRRPRGALSVFSVPETPALRMATAHPSSSERKRREKPGGNPGGLPPGFCGPRSDLVGYLLFAVEATHLPRAFLPLPHLSAKAAASPVRAALHVFAAPASALAWALTLCETA